MKKLISIVAALALMLMLAACGSAGELAIDANDQGAHAVASGSATGVGTSSIAISEGEGLCINHMVEHGSFHVKVTSEAGKVVFDSDITNNIADRIDVEPGDYALEIGANNAKGTVDVIPYDKATQAEADAAMPDSVREALGEGASAAASAAN